MSERASNPSRHPCADCGRLIYVGFQRCGDCANTPPHLTTHGMRRLYQQAGYWKNADGSNDWRRD